MRPHRRCGFTLVEILIVVVILGLLAALVIPHATSAVSMSTKAALRSQLHEIRSQVELYRTRHTGFLPTTDSVDPMIDGGWGVMVSKNYLKIAPYNSYPHSVIPNMGALVQATVAVPNSPTAWFFETAGNLMNIWAAGYDPINDKLSNE